MISENYYFQNDLFKFFNSLEIIFKKIDIHYRSEFWMKLICPFYKKILQK